MTKIIFEGKSVSLIEHETEIGNHGYGGSELSYTLLSEGASISIDKGLAEKLMLAHGVGERVYCVDKDGVSIEPRIRQFAECYPQFQTKEEARAFVIARIDRNIEELQRRKNHV